jgi:hypothetical protein
LSSYLLSKNLKIKIYRITVLPIALYCFDTWFLTLREEHRLRVFENWVLRRGYMDLRGRTWWEAEEKCTVRNIITCLLHQIYIGSSNQGG